MRRQWACDEAAELSFKYPQGRTAVVRIPCGCGIFFQRIEDAYEVGKRLPDGVGRSYGADRYGRDRVCLFQGDRHARNDIVEIV